MATADDWKARLRPMEGRHWPIRCGLGLTAEDMLQLREGMWPRDTDDRWAVWLDEQVLRCWRSWTSICVYEGRVVTADDGSGTVCILRVLDEPRHYSRAQTEAGELDRFEGVVGLALTGQVA